MAKESYYFSHDSNAITDTKILNMRADYGLEGYGLYWCIVEMLRNQEDYCLKLDKNTYRAIKLLSASNIEIEKYINDCCNEYELFKVNEDKFYSNSLLNRMKEKDEKSEMARKNAEVRWGKCKSNANEMQLHSDGNAIKKRKEKESKENKSKVKENKIHFAEFVTMTNAEHEKLVSTYGKDFANQCIKILDNYKGSSGKKYASDYRAMLNWVVDKVKNSEKSQKLTAMEEFLNENS
jgi:hypothetical protein